MELYGGVYVLWLFWKTTTQLADLCSAQRLPVVPRRAQEVTPMLFLEQVSHQNNRL